MTLPATLTIARWTGSRPGTGRHDGITIRLRDAVSGVEFLEAELTLEDFAQALFSAADRPAQVVLRGLDVLGMEAEGAPRNVWVPKKDRTWDGRTWTATPEAKEAVQHVARELDRKEAVTGATPFTFSENEIGNSHRIIERGEDGYVQTIHFRRFVPAGTRAEGEERARLAAAPSRRPASTARLDELGELTAPEDEG